MAKRTPPQSFRNPASRRCASEAVSIGISLLLLGVTTLTSPAVAQGTPPIRNDFVFHVYVDPLFGDDALAMQFNPNGTDPQHTPPAPLSVHPHIDNDPSSLTYGEHTITGFLQHAPYPFRTLSGGASGNGALNYIATRIGGLPTGTTPNITNVVIHCLPGLYGPRLATPIDSVSGLPFNGEQFPIVLDQPFVSLQGTSALDTVFDARATSTTILRIERYTSVNPYFPDAFVDGIAFRNARIGSTTGSGAAIWLRGLTPICASLEFGFTITNCFFQGNAVGIAVDSNGINIPNVCLQSSTGVNRIFNNTFAWNSIGIWQGNLGSPGGSVQIHYSAIANNIFDLSSPPVPGLPQPLSCFEGVSSAEREVVLRGTVSLLDPINSWGQDFNAFPDGRTDPSQVPATFNNGATIGSFILTTPTSLPEVLPRVDLLPLTPIAGTGLVRTLFVADALRNAPNGVICDHDLRLCPNVGLPSVTGAPDPNLLNPCVNAGIDAGTPASLDIKFRSQTILCSGLLGLPSYGMPGSPVVCGIPTPPADVEEAPISAWDFDSEGFGNARIVLPPGFPIRSDQVGSIDIGADELDSLILAGFVDGTRILTVVPTAPVGQQFHTRAFFFGRIATSDPRPVANTILGRLFPWYQHVQDGAASIPPDRVAGNYTNGAMFNGTAPSVRSLQFPTSTTGYPQRRPFPRNLECDFSGYLTSDFHPLWGLMFGVIGGPPWSIDGYSSNPWFETFDTTPAPNSKRLWNPLSPAIDFLSDNQCLYHNRGASPLHRTTWFTSGLLPAETFVLSGHINPPLTFPSAIPNSTWLVSTFGTAQYGPFGTCSGNTLNYSGFSFNDSPGGCPDVIPQFPGEDNLGRRFNLELPVATGVHRNLQTYLHIFPGELPLSPPSPTDETQRTSTRAAASEMRARIRSGGSRQ